MGQAPQEGDRLASQSDVYSFNFLVIWTPGLDKEPQERFVGFFPRLIRYLEDYRVW